MPNLPESRLRVSVCPHGGGREVAAWAAAIAYLRTRTSLPLGWFPAVDFSPAERGVLSQTAAVYADPALAFTLADRHGFVPVAAATDPDGVFLVARRDVPATMEDVEGARVAVLPGTFAAVLGLGTLLQRGLRPRPVPASSWQQAVRWVLSGECALGLLCEATYRILALRTLRSLRVVAGPWNASVAHLWLVRRDHSLLAQRLEEALLAMDDDAEGRSLLAMLGVTGWRRPAGELETARHILTQADVSTLLA